MGDIWKTLIPVAIAIGGWVFTFWLTERNRSRQSEKERERRAQDHEKDLREHRREKNLERLDEQIEKLYGPLHANLLAGEAVWETFWKMFKPSHGQSGYFHPQFENTSEELGVWRRWIIQVFQPINRDLSDIIIKNAQLIEPDDEQIGLESGAVDQGVYPDEFLQLIAHVKAYDGIIAAWAEGDYRYHTAEKNFPKELRPLVEEKYFNLVRKRLNLLQAKM
ncbi:hypothetical protein [Ruegeria hyattellae]|uniref:hypothetical protein n=1 Tax=Ruegeria hyattellae TaxID=3233337 RepID=UPI00355B3B50